MNKEFTNKKLEYVKCVFCGTQWVKGNMEMKDNKCKGCYRNHMEAKLWGQKISLVEYRNAESEELIGTFKNVSIIDLAENGYLELRAFGIEESKEFIDNPIVWEIKPNEYLAGCQMLIKKNKGAGNE